ncbi:MAG TPA: pitrilysin family protein [Pseudobacteroides sp.]|uniref:EF-P 5-aminopentanol modification-associated protein YfmH n=1 Tax=Pseudobacteroides sp. TaxID=1968840 RepID=UPI002F92A238
MEIKKIEYSKINEELFMYEHESGLKAFVIPKKGYSKKHAAFATYYGSVNNKFIAPYENDITSVPDGIAHFLEHKLFEQKDGSVMDKFSMTGASPNAYTSFTHTVYLFSCTDKFDENFDMLLDYVQNPYITEESVEKEKGIIGQEIRMYEDDPNWRAFFNLLGAFYKEHPVRIDIAGTVESISKINRDNLLKCYNTFYHPSNMVIVVVGDVDPEETLNKVAEGIKSTEHKPEIKRIFPESHKGINKDYVEQNLSVSIPIFQMGFKDELQGEKGFDSLKREVVIKLLLEMIVGRSSSLYNELYEEGLINSSFDSDYTIEEDYAFSMIGGESAEPLKVKNKILEEIKSLKSKGLDKKNFDRIRNAMRGRFIKQLNSVEKISHLFIPAYFKGSIMFDYFDVYDKITFEYANEVFLKHFDEDNFALSVIKPIKGD